MVDNIINYAIIKVRTATCQFDPHFQRSENDTDIRNFGRGFNLD